MLILDANVLISAVLGRSRSFLDATSARGVVLGMPEAQLWESQAVLVRLGYSPDFADESLSAAAYAIGMIKPTVYDPFEAAARERLGARGQSDWPVLAAALALEADIWSNDRDFFGVGVAVWTTRNVGRASQAGMAAPLD